MDETEFNPGWIPVLLGIFVLGTFTGMMASSGDSRNYEPHSLTDEKIIAFKSDAEVYRKTLDRACSSELVFNDTIRIRCEVDDMVYADTYPAEEFTQNGGTE